MNAYDLTIEQLKRAIAIKEEIEVLSKELRSILGEPSTSHRAPKRRAVSALARRRMGAAQKARWAKLRAKRTRSVIAKNSN
jgi:hypothetical protein